MIFSEELRRRRQAMGLGQIAFAMRIRQAAAQRGWSEPALDGNTVSRWEGGRQMPDAFHQVLLGDVLGGDACRDRNLATPYEDV
jgi:transcriptional regulator with XRE-family HTH domain